MKTPREIVEARWPGWIAKNPARQMDSIPILAFVAETERELVEFAIQGTEIKDASEEIARICREKKQEIRP